MPTYEYECAKCGHRLEVFQSITANPLRKCPSCKKLGLKRLIGRGAGIIFKGSGFYETDYKRSGASKGSSVGSSPEKSEKKDAKKGPDTASKASDTGD